MAVVDEDLVPLLMQPGTDVPTSLDDMLFALRPAWVADAACREHTEVDFFPERGEFLDEARAVCAGCLVRRDCLAYALDHGVVGVWGGTSGRGRWSARPSRPGAVLLGVQRRRLGV